MLGDAQQERKNAEEHSPQRCKLSGQGSETGNLVAFEYKQSAASIDDTTVWMRLLELGDASFCNLCADHLQVI